MKVSRMIGRSPPKDVWLKLNTDGAFRASDGMAMAGGLVRDGYSNWVAEFSAKLGHCSVTYAELWGVHEGLALAWDLGFRRVQLEVDSQVVVTIIKQDGCRVAAYSAVADAIREQLHCAWQVEIKHIF